MATTSEIISWVIKRQAQGYNRVADVLPIINECHKLFYKHETSQAVITNSNGRLPFLRTIKGVYEYSAPVVNSSTPWSVAYVLLREPLSRDYNIYDYQFSEPPPVNTVEYVEFGGNYYYPYQFVRTLDALEDQSCRIVFSRNPGNTTNKFSLLMYRRPREILSDRIQLQLPDRDGAHMMYFFPAVMKMIEAQNHGNYMEAVEYIESYLKPKYWKVMNSGAQGRRHKTMSRYF